MFPQNGRNVSAGAKIPVVPVEKSPPLAGKPEPTPHGGGSETC
jgi:hypothetical protein